MAHPEEPTLPEDTEQRKNRHGNRFVDILQTVFRTVPYVEAVISQQEGEKRQEGKAFVYHRR